MRATTQLFTGDLSLPPAPPELSQVPRYFGNHSKSFAFAAALVPEPHRTRLSRVYAWCRYADDLVDRHPAAGVAALERVDRWIGDSLLAYRGQHVENPLLRETMRDMAESQVPFLYAVQLAEGMRMDIRGTRYDTLRDLREYCHRVASTVGLWLTELFGVHDPWTLDRAAMLGFGMQLTNIVRDVGEDWAMGRLYLPASLMRTYGLEEAELPPMIAGQRPISPAFRAVIEAMITTAEASYRHAFDAIPALPPAFRRTVAVAAEVHRGIHDEVRAANYDTLTRRASTSLARKCVLAARALRAPGIIGPVRLPVYPPASRTVPR